MLQFFLKATPSDSLVTSKVIHCTVLSQIRHHLAHKTSGPVGQNEKKIVCYEWNCDAFVTRCCSKNL